MTSESTARFVRRPLTAAVEIVASEGSRATIDWLHASNVVTDELPGSLRTTLLPTAQGRWLWLEPDAGRLPELLERGLIVVDVDGKWVTYAAEPHVARRILAAALDVDEVLRLRGCASVTLFDCPAVLARLDGGETIVCVCASYAGSFEAACATSTGFSDAAN